MKGKKGRPKKPGPKPKRREKARKVKKVPIEHKRRKHPDVLTIINKHPGITMTKLARASHQTPKDVKERLKELGDEIFIRSGKKAIFIFPQGYDPKDFLDDHKPGYEQLMKRITDWVDQAPGISSFDIRNKLGKEWNQGLFQLAAKRLKAQGSRVLRRGRFLFFYPPQGTKTSKVLSPWEELNARFQNRPQALMDELVANPGSSTDELCKALDVSRATVKPILEAMESQSKVKTSKDGKTVLFYPFDHVIGMGKDETAALERITSNPGVTTADLLEATSLQRSQLFKAINDLTEGKKIITVRVGKSGYAYYPAGFDQLAMKERADSFLSDVKKRMLDAVKHDPGIPSDLLAKKLGIDLKQVQYECRLLVTSNRLLSIKEASFYFLYVPGSDSASLRSKEERKKFGIQVLDEETGGKASAAYAYVKANQGVQAGSLAKAICLGIIGTNRVVDELEALGIFQTHKIGKFRCVYTSNYNREIEYIADSERQLLDIIMRAPGKTEDELSQMGKFDTAIYHVLKALAQRGKIETVRDHRSLRYYPKKTLDTEFDLFLGQSEDAGSLAANPSEKQDISQQAKPPSAPQPLAQHPEDPKPLAQSELSKILADTKEPDGAKTGGTEENARDAGAAPAPVKRKPGRPRKDAAKTTGQDTAKDTKMPEASGAKEGDTAKTTEARPKTQEDAESGN